MGCLVWQQEKATRAKSRTGSGCLLLRICDRRDPSQATCRNSMARGGTVLLVTAIAILTAAARADDGSVPSWLRGELGLSAAVEVSSGDYGTRANTDILYLPFSVTYRPDEFGLTPYRGDWIELEVTVPYIRVRSPVYVADGASTSGRQTGQGLGDVIARLRYLVAPPRDSWIPFIELVARVKAPTADEDKYLGTGKTDVGIELTLSKRFGKFTPFGGLGYRWIGDPAAYDLQNRWLASAGLVYGISPRWGLGLLYEWREAAASWSKDAHELLPYASIRVSRHLRLEPYGIVGVSDGSPDLGAGLQIRAAIPLR